MFGEKSSKILKLPPGRNWFTLAMTNKLVVIINCLKVPKIKKTLLHTMKFLVPNYSWLQKLWLGGYRPQIPVLSVLNWNCWYSPNKIPGYATAVLLLLFLLFFFLVVITFVDIFRHPNVTIYKFFKTWLSCHKSRKNNNMCLSLLSSSSSAS